jgi:hypothetical protein
MRANLLSILFLMPWQPVVPTAPPFVLRTLDGKSITGAPTSLSADGKLSVQSQELTTFPLTEIQWLRRADRALPGPPRTAYLLFANGDRLPAQLLSADGERVRIRTSEIWAGQPSELPLSELCGYWHAPPNSMENQEQIQWAFEHEKPARDRFLLRNGDRLEGVWGKLHDARFEVTVNGKVESVLSAQLAAVSLFPALSRRNKELRSVARLTLADGSRITVDRLEMSTSGDLRVHAACGLNGSIPLVAVISIEPLSERVIYLSDLPPQSEKATPFLDVQWPLVRDGNAARTWLRVDGQVFDKGLGMHGAGEIVYLVDRKYRALEAVVGLDERAGRLGQARVRIVVDGEEKWVSPVLRGGEKALPVRVEISGATRISLRVDESRGGGVQCHVDWAEARLLRE